VRRCAVIRFHDIPPSIHPEYVWLRQDVEQSPTTFVLIPSLNYRLCVAETVRRQLTRPFAGSRIKEEAVIRERFRVYVDLPIRKIETMQPFQVIVDEIVKSSGCHEFREQTPRPELPLGVYPRKY
jgi:hypothetical protein